MDFLYQFDEKYAPYAAASICSLFENNKLTSVINIYLLCDGLSTNTVSKLESLGKKYGRQIIFLPSAELIEECKKLGIPSYRGSMLANLRLFAEYIMPSDVKRVVYLDSDTLVTSDISPLFETDMKGEPVGMVQDSLVRNYKLAIGLKKDDPYYNSGMILYDLDALKKGRYTERLIAHIKNVRAAYGNPDQDLLNAAFYGHIFEIHPKYNFQPVHRMYSIKDYYRVYGEQGYYSKKTVEEAVNAPAVYHFFRVLGQFPWNTNTIHPDRDMFYKYIGMTGFKDFKPVKDKGGLVFKIERMLYRIMPGGMFLQLLYFVHEKMMEREDRERRSTNGKQKICNEKI